MKKLFIALIILLLLTGCQSEEEVYVPEMTVIEKARDVDMSVYQDMVDYGHAFKEITADEMLDVIENGGSDIFYLGSDSCGVCQFLVRYMQEAASSLGVTIYYVDVYSDEDGFADAYDRAYEMLYDVLEEYEGEKAFQTPHVFVVKDGEIIDSLVGALEGYDGTDATADIMIDRYTEMFKALLD